jgi:hypothetical protein
MSDDKIAEIRARHVLYPPSRNARYSFITAYQDIATLLAEVERLRAERDALKTAAREFLTTLGAAMKTGKFHMNGSADMCHFVRQAMQKLDVLAFDREEKRPVGLERLHEESKP